MSGLLVLAAVDAGAQSVAIDVDEQKAQAMGLDSGSLESAVGGQIDTELQTGSPDSYMQQLAEADAIALKGMGVDYATNPKLFSLGGTLGTGVAGRSWTLSRGDDLPDGGYAFMASLHGGVNLGALVPGDGLLDKVTVYVNGLAFQPPTQRAFQATMFNVGAHVQLKVLGPIRAEIVEWGGFDFTTGYERSLYELELGQGLPISQTLAPATITWDGAGTYTIRSRADTVPLEVSTNLRVFMVTAYGGAAADLRGATAETLVDLSGPLDAAVNGDTDTVGTASVDVEAKAAADLLSTRWFGGLQFNVGPLKVYGHVNVASEDRYGGFMGVRLAL